LLRRLAREYPDLFFTAAAKLLESDADSPAHRFLAALLVRQESFFECLTNPARCSCESAVNLFRRLLRVDPTLDFRLARVLPGRNDFNHGKVLRGGHGARAMDILDQTSRGQRLMSVVGHLPNSADPKISAKAALFVGRRINNAEWTAKQLARDDHRLRANAVEASWGAKSEAAIRILESCADDPSNRVVGNALVGLHLAERPDVVERVLGLSQSEKPGLRSTAAWAMGKIGSALYIEPLTSLLRDENPQVRSTAIRSLSEIGRAEERRLAAIAAIPKVVATEKEQAPEPVVAEPVDKPVEAEIPVEPFNLKLDGSSTVAQRWYR
jgi:hypothetical protein